MTPRERVSSLCRCGETDERERLSHSEPDAGGVGGVMPNELRFFLPASFQRCNQRSVFSNALVILPSFASATATPAGAALTSESRREPSGLVQEDLPKPIGSFPA